MKLTFILTLISLSLISCSPKSENKQSKKENEQVGIAHLIKFNNINSDLLRNGTSVLKNKNGDSLPSNQVSLDIEVDDQGTQLIRLKNSERRSSIDMVISEEVAPTGISMSHDCPSQLRRRQSCNMKIDIDASSIGVGSFASYDITVNNEVYTFQYNVIQSTKLTPEEEAEGLIELSPNPLSSIDLGTLEKTEGEKATATIQLRNKSRKTLPIIVDHSELSSISLISTCESNLDRGQACLLFLSLDSSLLDSGAISENVTVSGRTYSLEGIIHENSQIELEAYEQAIADNAMIIQPSTSLDLGSIKQGKIKIENIKIYNQSREDISLSIDDSSLNEFSIGSCPSILRRKRSCFLNVSYDAGSASLGAKSESLSIGNTTISLGANIIEGTVQNGNGFCNNYDKTLASYFLEFPEVGDFIESLACSPFSFFAPQYAGIVFDQPYEVPSQNYQAENTYRINDVIYNGMNGQCTIEGLNSDNYNRLYYQKNGMSADGCFSMLQDMNSQILANHSSSTGDFCVGLSQGDMNWFASLFNMQGVANRNEVCTDLNTITMNQPCTNNSDQSACDGDSNNNCYWNEVDSFCMETKISCYDILDNEGLCEASPGCEFNTTNPDNCSGANEYTPCYIRDQENCPNATYNGKSCVYDWNYSVCEEEQESDPACENNTQEQACTNSIGNCYWEGETCQQDSDPVCENNTQEQACMYSTGNCLWDGSSCTSPQDPDPVCENNTQEPACLNSTGNCQWDGSSCTQS